MLEWAMALNTWTTMQILLKIQYGVQILITKCNLYCIINLNC
jgi:hypothetical protein